MKAIPLLPVRHGRSGHPAFTLTELLVVLSIMTLLAVLSLTMFHGVIRGNRLNSGLLALGGVFDSARQHAIAKNTFAWVLISPGNSPGQDAKVVTIVSKSGTDSLAWAGAKLSLPSAAGTGEDLEMMEKIRSLPAVSIEDDPTVEITTLPVGQAESVGLASVNIEIRAGGQTVTFTRALQFTPSGEARVSDAITRYIDLAVLPQPKAGADGANQAVLRVAGLTGRTVIYRN